MVIHGMIKYVHWSKANNPGKEITINMVNTILELRKQRTGMVQTVEQYEFCHVALADGLKKEIGSDNKSKEEKPVVEEKKSQYQQFSAVRAEVLKS